MDPVYRAAGDRMGNADHGGGSCLRCGILPLWDGQPGPGAGGAGLPGVGRGGDGIRSNSVDTEEVRL